MSDRYRLHRDDNGDVYVYEGSGRHTHSPFRPQDLWDETVLDALLALLNDRHDRWQITGKALEFAEQVGIAIEPLRLRYLTRAYLLYRRMRQYEGFEGHRPWRP